jgi:SET domain-containing protein
MPKCFKFEDRYRDETHNEVKVEFECVLKSERCNAETKTGTRCRNNVVIGLPYCFIHTRTELNLQIQESEIEGAGKGVFAHNPHADNGRVFKRGEFICEYLGEVLTADEVDERYGHTLDTTAPYVIQVSANRFIDAACKRGVAGVINHSTTPNVEFYTYRNTIRCRAIKNINHGTELKASYHGNYEFQDNHQTFSCRK